MNKFLIIPFILLLFASCKSPEARRPISANSGSFIEESVERNKKLYAKEKVSIEAIMDKSPENNYLASQSGFWYYYNTKIADSIAKPNFGDIVNFNYNVKSLNGELIYSKAELRTQKYAMDKQELFTGLREGLKLMKAGETITFLFPSPKAYGYYGDNKKIGRSIPLICEVTVNSITQNQSN